MAGLDPRLSLPGLTRQSIRLRKMPSSLAKNDGPAGQARG
jgi:hypothetical protein